MGKSYYPQMQKIDDEKIKELTPDEQEVVWDLAIQNPWASDDTIADLASQYFEWLKRHKDNAGQQCLQ